MTDPDVRVEMVPDPEVEIVELARLARSYGSVLQWAGPALPLRRNDGRREDEDDASMASRDEVISV